MNWLLPTSELTIEQNRAIELSSTEHRLIFGGPGSGKTQILLHRARYLCDTLRVDSDCFHIFVFTNVLKNYIKSALDLLRLPDNCVSTLDGWCTSFYKKHIGWKLPWNAYLKCPDFTAIRKAVLNKILDNEFKKPFYDFILIDEGQDLDRMSFEMLSKISKHITVCIDHKQKIYEKGADENEILRTLGLRKRNMTLLDGFRCCPYIVQLASNFIENDEDRDTYIRQSRTEQTEKETPLLYYASNFEDEKQRLMEIVKTRLMRNEKIAIILPQNRQVYGFADGLIKSGLNVEWSVKSEHGEYNFNSQNPKVLTFHSAKGLTFDTVIIPRLVTKSFQKLNENEISRLLFVGISRAQKWVALISDKKDRLPQLKKLDYLANNGGLTIQENQKWSSSQNELLVEKNDNELTDLL